MISPEYLARLAKLAMQSRALGAPPPFADPVVIDESGVVWLPHPDPDLAGSGETIGCYLHAGLRLGWAPMTLPPPGGVLLTLFGGPAAEMGFEEDGVATFITRDGLKALIADLQAIVASVEAQS